MKTMKKIFASILVMCMVLAMPNMAALAADGTSDSPYELTMGEETVSITDAEKASDGVYYTYTAPTTDTGYVKLSLAITSETEGVDYYITVQSSDYTIWETYDSANANSSTFEVAIPSGKTVSVNVYSYDEKVFEIKWTASYKESAAPGSEENPVSFSFYGDTYGAYPKMAVGANGYYYVTEAPMDGTLAASLDYESMIYENEVETITASITLTNVTKNNATSTADADGETAKVAVSTGDEVVIHIVISEAGELTEAEASWFAQVLPEEGASGNPIVIEEGNYTEETPLKITVAAGKEVFYKLDYNSNYGNTLVISGENFTSAFGQMYGISDPVEPTDGKIEMVLQRPYLDSNHNQLFLFSIKNTGDAEATYDVVITAPLGTEGNPEEIKFEEGKTTGSNSHIFEYTTDSGKYSYFYKWVATEDGYVRLTVSATVEDGVDRTYMAMVEKEDGSFGAEEVTIEGDVWYYNAYNTEEDGDVISDFSKVDGENDTVENGQLIYVEKGDVVMIKLQAYDVTTGLWVDSTVKAELEYVDLATGSEESAIKDIENFTPVEDEEPIIEIELKDENGETSSVISKEVLEALKDKDLSVMMYFGSHYWVINGQDIETAEDLDLSINFETTKIPEALVNKVITDDMIGGGPIELVDNDDFGLVASLVFDFGTSYSGCHVNLFYYNAEGNLECVATNTVNTDGLVAFNFEHASEYVVQISEDEVEVGTVIEPDKTSDTTTPGGGTTTPGGDTTTPGGDTTTPDDDKDTVDKLGDLANPMIYVIVLLGAALVGAGFVAKKRFA